MQDDAEAVQLLLLQGAEQVAGAAAEPVELGDDEVPDVALAEAVEQAAAAGALEDGHAAGGVFVFKPRGDGEVFELGVLEVAFLVRFERGVALGEGGRRSNNAQREWRDGVMESYQLIGVQDVDGAGAVAFVIASNQQRAHGRWAG